MNVVVVGGGVAGIVAALDCAAAGASVTLVEVRPRLGGAAYSVERATGSWLDNGQHVFLRCCTRLPRAARDARLASTASSCSRAWRSRCSRRGARRRSCGAAARGRRCISRARCCATAISRCASACAPAAPRSRSGALAPDDSRTLGDWLARARPEPARDRRAVGPDRAADAQPARRRRPRSRSARSSSRRACLSDAAAGDIGLHRAPLQQIIGDPAARARSRARASTVHLRWRAERVARSASRFAVVGAGGSFLGADAVIVAVPARSRRGAAARRRAARRALAGRARQLADRQPARRLRPPRARARASRPASTRRCSTCSTARRPAGRRARSTSRCRSRAPTPSSR